MPMVPHDDIATKTKHKAKFFIWTSQQTFSTLWCEFHL
jgi:hypothetical protein